MKLPYLRSIMTLLFLSSAASAQTLNYTPWGTSQNTGPTTLVTEVVTKGSQATLPEVPVITRNVTGTKYLNPDAAASSRVAVHTKPHVPTFHTSRDGRIGIDFKTAKITLLRPEQLGSATATSETAANSKGGYIRQIVNTDLTNNSYVMTNKAVRPIRFDENGSLAQGSPSEENTRDDDHKNKLIQGLGLPAGGVRHVTLFDPTSVNGELGIKNPSYDSANNVDIYDLCIVSVYEEGTLSKIRFIVTRVTVKVSSPKTKDARITSFVRNGTRLAGDLYDYEYAQGLEPIVVAGGRLIALRLGGGELAWNNPEDSDGPTTRRDYNIVYSHNNESTISWPLNPKDWKLVHPISHAPYDPNIKDKLGFALQPFRDAAGNVINDGIEFGATYPWMDPDAKNLFFTVTGDILRYKQILDFKTGSVHNTRYESTGTPGGSGATGTSATRNTAGEAEDFGPTRGVSFVGLWSNGKIVTIDNLNNDMDYMIEDDLFSRDVRLFKMIPGLASGPNNNPNLTLGAGRVNDVVMPDGDTDNTGLIESLMNVFNYRKYAKPTTIQDVVWPMHNAKHTDDLAFDDYLDHNAFIVSNMTGLVALDKSYNLQYHSGWNASTNKFTLQVKLQNAATSTRLKVPASGDVTGKGRIEPAATGGIHGKGFWLEESIGINYAIPAQPATVTDFTTREWYVGMFLDCRSADNVNSRRLITFPDGTSIKLKNHSDIEYWSASATSATISINIPKGAAGSIFENFVPNPGWVHFAWQIKKGGTEIDFLLNGMLYARHPLTTSTALFKMLPSSTLSVGNNVVNSSLGFKGWIDDFKVLAHAVDPESACNHAGGTLVGLLASYPAAGTSAGYLREFNDRFPNNNSLAKNDLKALLEHRGERIYPAYANYYNYSKDNEVHLGNIPADTESLRQAIHFPEGPIFSNRPRPESSKNAFCLTCHTSTGEKGLGLGALTINTLITAPNDPRRTPAQPFPLLFGSIPAGLLDTVVPALPSTPISPDPNAPDPGILVDSYLLTTLARATVKTFSLLDASTGEELQSFVLTNGTNTVSGTLMLSNYPVTTQFAIRANLDFAQGSVNLVYDGGASVSRNMLSPQPYAIGIGRPSISTTAHTINATPSDSGGVTRSLSLIVNP
jgi:hypothetical protein